MPESHETNRDQATLWNQTSGQAWVEMQSLLDALLVPFNELLLQHSVRNDTTHVLDVGCGAGATTLSVARGLGPRGSCLGVDLSAPLTEMATKRAREEGLKNATFVQADAQTHPFEPGRFDAVLSRFGVMFFDDPVAAFINIRRAACSGAPLSFVAWRSPAENPFMTMAPRAAAPLLPTLVPPEPDTPGQFGFADPDRVRRILQASGWKAIDIRPVDVPMSMALPDLLTYITKMGPVGRALGEVDEHKRAQVTAAVHAACQPFIRGEMAHFSAACWLVNGRG